MPGTLDRLACPLTSDLLPPTSLRAVVGAGVVGAGGAMLPALQGRGAAALGGGLARAVEEASPQLLRQTRMAGTDASRPRLPIVLGPIGCSVQSCITATLC